MENRKMRKFSANEGNPTETTALAAPEKQTITRKYSYYDDNFVLVEKEVKFDFVPAASLQEALQRLNGEEKTAVAALNTAIQRKAGYDARNAAIGTGGVISKKAFLDFVKPYRNASPFKEMVTKNKGDDGWKDEYRAQTKALAEQVKSVPFMVAAIKSASANVLDDEDSD